MRQVVVVLHVERGELVQTEPARERVGDAGVCDVRVRVRDEMRDTAADHAMDERALRIVGRHPVHSGEQQRMVGDQQLRTALDRLGDGRRHRVDGEQHPRHVLVRIAADQTHRVPRFGPARIEPGIEDAAQVGEGRHRGNLPRPHTARVPWT